MISKVNENSVMLSRFKCLSISACGFLTLEYFDEVFGGHRRFVIVDLATGVYILSWCSSLCWLVEHFAREWVLNVMSNIIISHCYDVRSRYTIFPYDLVSMTDISLMTIISIPI